MQKQVVRFERETTVKDDICYEGGSFKPITTGVSCNNCRVHMVTDRFLSREFQRQVMKDNRSFPNGTYPYVIILDTAECNMRCRACYSWIYWTPEKSAMPAVVDARTLASQFRCKIEKLHDAELVAKKPRVSEKTKRPFSRFRISGGEPLYSRGGDSADYWLEYLGALDQEVGGLIDRHLITLHSESDWVSMGTSERQRDFPVFLKSDNGKLRIRFDTNGRLFDDAQFTEQFIGGIYRIAPKWIKVDLTFSLKGTTTKEVDWFVRQNSSYDPAQLHILEPLESHPQWKAIKNIRDAILRHENPAIAAKSSANLLSKSYFNPCGDLSLTVERGIMHNKGERLYLYNKEALNWAGFAEKLNSEGLELSATENCIYLGQYPTALAWRYMDKGKYELRFKCPEHPDSAFLSYSTKEASILPSMKHRRVSEYSDPNLKHLGGRIKIQNECVGKACKYGSRVCDYWIEFVPTN